jgi:CubicO group peptidase (beta-lactamase class C family)
VQLATGPAPPFSLDDKVGPLVDKILKSGNGTTFATLFPSPLAADITVRHLLSMRSGINDYDNSLVQHLTFSYPDVDLSPFDYLAIVNKVR